MPPRDAPAPKNSAVSAAELDAILGIQLTVSWAGEMIDGEERLAWWRSELTDPDAGGDFLARLLPRTHAWAALIAVREAARRVDAAARREVGRGDAVRSLFHLGFAVDERLDARLAEHRTAGASTSEVLGTVTGIRERFERGPFLGWLEALGPVTSVEVVPGGRQLKASPTEPLDATRKLARALLPLAGNYPLPFYLVGKP